MFATLEVAVKDYANTDWAAVDADERNDTLADATRLAWMLEAAQARHLEAILDTVSWAVTGARTAKAWTVTKLRLPANTCGSMVQLAGARRRAPLAAAAWDAGAISGHHLRRIAAANTRRTHTEFLRDQDRMVEWARHLRFDVFAHKIDEWQQHADPDGADLDEMERRARRHITLDETFGGMHHGSMLLDPVSGAVIANELQRLCDQLRQQDWAEAKDRLGHDPHPHELARTPGQRRCDAMVQMAIRSATMPANGKAPRPLFTVVLGNQAFQRTCRLEGGPTVAPAALTPWINDADLERILFADGEPRVIDVSRKRRFLGALRRLIQVRDGECFHPYCAAVPDRCDIDHITPHSHGGLTEQTNGRLACGPHNRARNHTPDPDGDSDGDDLS